MDSLPQELFEEIIDNLPHFTLLSSSLVARRWRTRSQQRILYSITAISEARVNRWHADIQGGKKQIASYVRCVELRYISSWDEPAVFGRILSDFCSLKKLKVDECAIPGELPGQILHGKLGGGITILSLWCPRCNLSTIISMVLSFPNLKKLTVAVDEIISRQPSPASIVSQRRSLDVLELHDHANKVAEALIQFRFTSRCICLGSSISSGHRLLAISSEMLVALMLKGVWFVTGSQVTEAVLTIFADTVARHFSIPLIHLPPFPVLTSLRVSLYKEIPSRSLVNLLSSIYSTPSLTSIDVQRGPIRLEEPAPSHAWDDLDRWLARVFKRTTVECGLVLNLRWWRFSKSSWEALLPRFSEVGGEIKIHADGWIDNN